MKLISKATLLALLAAISCATVQAAPKSSKKSAKAEVEAVKLPRAVPSEVGLDGARLAFADREINAAIARGEFPGAVLAVVKEGKMAYLKAYGKRAWEPDSLPMTTETIFDMASCSKVLSTAISTMMLVDQGYLRLEDAVSKYIPDFKDYVGEDSVTTTIHVNDLLTHTSGLPAYAPVATISGEAGSPCPEALMNWICNCKRIYKPRTDFVYSCLNFVTLQNIIQNITGKRLCDFAKENIFDVLGMTNSFYNTTGKNLKGNFALTERQADGTVLCGQVHDPLARVLNGGNSGNAGLFTTADDIAVLVAALQNGGEWNGKRILSQLAVKAMRTVPRFAQPFGRSLGWDVYSDYATNAGSLLSPNTYCHSGYTGTSVVIDPDNDISVILLTNSVHPTDSGTSLRLRTRVANIVAGAIDPTVRKHTNIQHYHSRYLQFEQEEPINSNTVVMLGNSLTQGGGDWAKLLDCPEAVNRGIIGDEVMGIYDRLHQILPGKPKKIFFLSGVNDLSHHLSADTIVEMTARVVDRIAKESPETKIYIQSLLPINESFKRYRNLNGTTDTIPEINKKLKAMCKEKGVTYIHLFDLFVEAKGSNVLKAEYTADGLHIKKEFYPIWADAIRKYVHSK